MDLTFVKFSDILIHDQKIPKLLARYFKLNILNPSFMFAQAIQNEASANRSPFLRG